MPGHGLVMRGTLNVENDWLRRLSDTELDDPAKANIASGRVAQTHNPMSILSKVRSKCMLASAEEDRVPLAYARWASSSALAAQNTNGPQAGKFSKALVKISTNRSLVAALSQQS